MENRVDYNKEMAVEDWTEGMYKNLSAIKVGVWLLVILECAKFVIW
jgi:hypothetical protein